MAYATAQLENPASLFDVFLRDIAQGQPSTSCYRALIKIGHAIHLEAGTVATYDHDNDMIAYLVSGATKLIASASGGREHIVAFHFGGDLISIPAGTWHAYDLRALTHTHILLFPANDFVKATADEPSFSGVLLKNTLNALHRSRDRAVGLGRKNAAERLASFLVEMVERQGQAVSPPLQLELPMSRRDIGDNLGLTIETVSRQFGDLKQLDLIETAGRSKVILRDLDGLKKRAGHVGKI